MKKTIKIFGLLSLLLFILAGCEQPKEKNEFVKVDGTDFIYNSEPHYFMGTNYWYGAYLGSPGDVGDRERLKSELDMLKEMGVTNLRILAASEESEILNSVTPAFQKSPGEYNEELLQGLDYLLYEMEKRDLHAVLFLNNYWEWSGGMSQHINWVTGEDIPDPAREEYSWDEFMNFPKRMYNNDEALDIYNDYIRMIINRTNTYTGKPYYEDPTIMAWELANEPRPGDGELGIENLPAFYEWVNNTAALIKSLAPNQLVTTGGEGEAGCLELKECVIESHKSEDIDYVSVHLWAFNWGWFDPDNMDKTLPVSIENAEDYIKRHLPYAEELNKPMVLGEFGFRRDHGKYEEGTPTTARDKYFKHVFQIIHESAKEGGPLVGSNFWGWSGEGRAQHEDFWWRPGDPFTADPPQEHQGLNAVFDVDTTTIEIIKRYSNKMQSINN